MIVQHCWNGSIKGQPKHLEKNLTHFHFVHHKSHFDCPGIGQASVARDGQLTSEDKSQLQDKRSQVKCSVSYWICEEPRHHFPGKASLWPIR